MQNHLRIIFLAFLSICFSSCFYFAEDQEMQNIRIISQLPENVDETSGIELHSPGKVWTFNDSGGEPELYLCDTMGNLLSTIKVPGAWNRDWEDMTQDDQGNLYIGNIGNNNNDNTDLTIFKIPNPDSVSLDSIQTEVISISYEDQYSFPPPKDSMNFDCEAMLWREGNLYLFSKHRTLPMATNLYRIPDSAGTYVAKKISSFYTGEAGPGEHKFFAYWITAADISQDGTKVAIISGKKVWVFSGFQGDDFFNGTNIVIDFGVNSQKEAVVFVDNSTLYLTDEYWANDGIGRNLYEVKLDLPN